MTNITEKQLIESLKSLKEIKPRKEWAVLLKSQIIAEKQTETVISNPARFAGIVDTIFSAFSNRKLVYAFAAILVIVFGAFGATKLLPTAEAPKQTALLTTPSQQVLVLKNQINTTVRGLSQNLKNNPAQDPQAIKILAKTLADMPGEVTSSPDVKDLMQTVVETEISDLQKITLTDSQKITLTQAQDLDSQGKYVEALEQIMVINN